MITWVPHRLRSNVKTPLTNLLSSNHRGELNPTISSKMIVGSSQFRASLTSSSQNRNKYLPGFYLVLFSGFTLK